MVTYKRMGPFILAWWEEGDHIRWALSVEGRWFHDRRIAEGDYKQDDDGFSLRFDWLWN